MDIVNDIDYRGKNVQIHVSAEMRKKIRRVARATMVISGISSAVMGAYMLTAALMRQGWFIPFAVCTVIAVYVRKVVAKT